MRKILIAINGDFLRETYKEVFKSGGFNPIMADNGDQAFELAKKEKMDLIMIEATFPRVNGFELIQKLKKEGINTPVIILDQYEDKETMKKAMEMEAKDFIAFSSASPNEILRKIKIVLGEQKSYRIKISGGGEDLYRDMGHSGDLKCQECGSDLELNLIRDLSVSNSHFVVSFVCPNNCN